MLLSRLLMIMFSGSLAIAACKKQSSSDVKDPMNEDPQKDSTEKIMTDDAEFRTRCQGLQFQTLWELQQARSATAKYQDIENAYRDEYADINVILPMMGYHFMRQKNLDAKFEIRKPELLVYNKNIHGKFVLVAIEYAVPLDLSPDGPPEGFTGSGDVWDRNTTFGLWTLHAWIWKFNPDGVFSPMNPNVIVR
jgi:hypothetical protein